MLLEGAISSDKTKRLIDCYVKLLSSGIKSSKILVLVQNSSKKNQFIEETLKNLTVDTIEKLNIYSFFGLIYNAISDNWAEIENKIPEDENTKIIPNLTGLEISQYILKEIISDIKFEGYNSHKSLLHQLFRRYSLIVQNHLSESDVKWRSEEVLKESFAPDAESAIREFKKETLNLRALDYQRQCLIFEHFYKNTKYFSDIEYLILDDGDEITPACFDFIKAIKPQLKDSFIAYDALGSSRCGYLSADKSIEEKFKATFSNSEIETLKPQTKLKEDANAIFQNITEQKATSLENVSLYSHSKRAQMIDSSIKEIKELISKKGVNPKDISIITPLIDDMLKFCLKDIKANIISLSGSEKIVQNKIVHASINILKVCNEDIKNDLTEFDIRAIFDFLQIPLKHCREILQNFDTTKEFTDYKFSLDEYNEIYGKFLDTLQDLPKFEKLSEQVFEIYDKLVDIKDFTNDELNKFNFFIKQLEDFEKVFGKRIKNSEIITQIENSIISENPYAVLEIKENDLVVATPQKIIDNQVQTKYQFWLDVSSDEWIKSDTGPLYNAWVFQSDWNKDDFTIEDNIELSNRKNAGILRKLALCANEHIFAYASLFDGSGIENFGGIEKYLTFTNKNKTVIKSKEFIPRDDQKPVLEYKSGRMAISAVPGAGKTTILLELIINLLNKNVAPENIFVLTYMESAARNFRERIQNANKDLSQLPNISTIHGLALRILKENGNFERLGLNADFEICDDTQRSRILNEVSAKFKLKKTEIDDFDKAVSILKIGNAGKKIEINSTADEKLSKFFKFYEEYVKILQSNNLIDYDDMLLMSVRLLEENQDIKEYYQEICNYIIEDEAQDSSAIQQRLIEILSAKHKNLIRCGDINQAITTTFSNADVEGFRHFIEQGETKVSMNRSQRCCEDVWKLANNLVSYSQSSRSTQNAFYPILMRPVDGKNPQSSNAIKNLVLENEFAERNYVLKQIKELLTKTPKATIGILLRSNYSVGKWTNFISNSGLKTITRSECLEQKGIFRTIFAIMKIIQNPFDNEILAQNYETLAELGHCKSNLFQILKELPTPFIEMNVDEMNNIGLETFYWDLIYWLSFSTLPPEELAIKIGLSYYSSDIEKSNVYLISTLIKRLSTSYKTYSSLIEHLGLLSKKTSLSGFKFFSEEEKSDKEILEGKVQVMTLHKSKGDEFDYVFLPEMTEGNLALDFENVKLKKNARFMEAVRETNSQYKHKTDDEVKEFLLAENLRLMYVAITRAKRKLFITANKTEKYSKVPQPCKIFEII